MADLIAQGSESRHRWRRRIPTGETIVIGRASGVWSVGWDDRVSRRHVELRWREGALEVRRLPGATNPVYHSGTAQDAFRVCPGEHFVIGNTTFTLTTDRAQVSLDVPIPANEQHFSAVALKQHRFRDAAQRIDALVRLPDLIASASGDAELCLRLVNVMLSAVSSAAAAAVVAVRDLPSGSSLEVLYWDRRRSGGDFEPSERLIRQAVTSGESVVHVWSADAHAAGPYTLAGEIDWAFCIPLVGPSCRGWALYVAGTFAREGSDTAVGPDPQSLRDELKFGELVASIAGSLRELRILERNRASLSQFFSPVVMESLAGQDPDMALAPRETEVAVLFCDLRGFSRQSEQAGNRLLDLLNRVSHALGLMTHHILEQGGVVGDFHGDAAMGFWGWPMAQNDAVARACRAALGIREAFAAASSEKKNPLADFQMGIGIAYGRAVAGKIGTIDQVKVTVFGPVVNLAARLEGMTKQLRAPILLEGAAAAAARTALSTDVARLRRVAVVLPYGLQTPVEVSELLPPESQLPAITNRHLAAYEEALTVFLKRDWETAFDLLHQVPAIDRVKDFLTVYMAQHNRTAPEGWNGCIPLGGK